MFRYGFARFAVTAFFVLAAISLLSEVAGSTTAAVGTALVFPFVILFKLMLFMFVIGLVAKAFGGGRHARWHQWTEAARTSSDRDTPAWAEWFNRPHRQPRQESPSKEELFEEWHRMAHAREEVDRWAPEV